MAGLCRQAVLLMPVMLLAVAPAGAVEVPTLYTAEVLYDREATDPRADAYAAALQTILLRVSGSELANNSAVVEELFPNPGSYVMQFRPGSEDTLWVSFDGEAIEQTLRNGGPEAAYEFAHGVCTREGLKAGDPALAFLNWLDRERRTGAGYSNGVRGTRKHALASARCLRAQVQKKRLDHVDGDSTQTNGKTKKGPVIKNECIRFPEEDVMKWLYSLRRPPKRKATAKRAAA